MRSEEFITEAEIKGYQSSTVDPIIENIVALINDHCSEAIPSLSRPIYRGIRNHAADKAIIIAPSTGVRKSNNTTNYYTELMDNSPYLSGWPKRSKSLICTTSGRYTTTYGARFIILPFNGAKIAVCPKFDIWGTKFKIPELGINIQHDGAFENFNDWLEDDVGFPETYPEMVSYVQSPEFAQSNLFTNRGWVKSKNTPDPTPEFRAEFIPMLLRAVSPARTGFKLFTVPEFVSQSFSKPREVWIGDKVLAVPAALLPELRVAFEIDVKKSKS